MDPGTSAFFYPWIRDTGWVKNPDPGWKNNPYHMYESLETSFWVKILKFFDADPGWKNFGSGIRKKTFQIRNTKVEFLHEK